MNIEGKLKVIPLEKLDVTEEAVASTAKDLIPSSIDFEKNIDILPITFPLAVVNQFNANDDGIDTEAAMAMVKTFVNKPLNIEHKKDIIVGHIVNASFSDKLEEFEEHDLEHFAGRTDHFYINASAVIYRAVYPELAEAIVESNDPTSPVYMAYSTSWEVGFEGFRAAVGTGSVADCEIYEKGTAEVHALKPHMRAYEGSGIKNGKRVRRLLHKDTIGLGAALTMNPAASVKGVYILSEMFEDEYKNDESDAEISQSKETFVNADNSTSFKMTEEQYNTLLEVAKASNGSEDIVGKIKETLDAQNNWQSKTEKAQTELAEAKTELETIKDQFQTAREELDGLKEEAKAKADAERFNLRVKAITDVYELSEAQEKIVVEDVKALDESEEAFAAYQEKASILFTTKEEAEASKKEEEAKQEEAKASEETKEEEKEEASASEEKEEKLETEDAEAGIANSTKTEEPSLLEKIKNTGLQVTTS